MSVRVSVSLALDSLRDACADVEDARDKLALAMEARDDLIIDAHGKVPARKLTEITGLSRDRLHTIAGSRHSRDADGV